MRFPEQISSWSGNPLRMIIAIYQRLIEDREILTFAFICFTIALYNLFSAGLYNPETIELSVIWQRLQFIGFVAFVYFVGLTKYRIVIFILGGTFILFLFANITIDSSSLFNMNHQLERSIDFGGILNIQFLEAEPGNILKFQYIFMMLSALYGLITVFLSYLSGNKEILSIHISLFFFRFYTLSRRNRFNQSAHTNHH